MTYKKIANESKNWANNEINNYEELIEYVQDRPGHDIRYALNSNKIKRELNWKPRINFKEGIKLTFDWYNKNRKYYKSISKKDILKRLGNKWLKKE